MTAKRNDTSGVIAPPPLLIGCAQAAGLLLHRAATRVLGSITIAMGLSASIAVTIAFRKAATAISPTAPTKHLVLTGTVPLSRNPDYIRQSVLYLGISLAANPWWTLLLLPPVLAVVVRREEQYLEVKFGREYRSTSEPSADGSDVKSQ